MPGLRTLTRIVGADLDVTFNISEESVADLSKHRYLTNAGYRIIRRYENNGWYAPRELDSHVPMVGSLGDLAQVLSRLAAPGTTQFLTPYSQTDHLLVPLF